MNTPRIEPGWQWRLQERIARLQKLIRMGDVPQCLIVANCALVFEAATRVDEHSPVVSGVLSRVSEKKSGPMTADSLTDEDRETLAIYADAIAKAKTDEEKEAIRQAIRELLNPQLLGNVVCLHCLREFSKCTCPNE